MAMPVDASLALGTLQTLSDLQGAVVDPLSEEEPGKILHEISLPQGVLNQGWKGLLGRHQLRRRDSGRPPIALRKVQAYVYSDDASRPWMAYDAGDATLGDELAGRAKQLKKWIPCSPESLGDLHITNAPMADGRKIFDITDSNPHRAGASRRNRLPPGVPAMDDCTSGASGSPQKRVRDRPRGRSAPRRCRWVGSPISDRFQPPAHRTVLHAAATSAIESRSSDNGLRLAFPLTDSSSNSCL